MPTARLGDAERSSIHFRFARVIGRIFNTNPFPIAVEDLEDWSISLLDNEVRKKWVWLKEESPKLVKVSYSYGEEFTINDGDMKYSIYLYESGLLHGGMHVPNNHPTHKAIVKWVKLNTQHFQMYKNATDWLNVCLTHCHSAGQVKRVLGDDILQYMPESLTRSLEDAERRSRMPRNFIIDKEKHENLKNTLALGSISPPESDAADARFVNVVTEILDEN